MTATGRSERVAPGVIPAAVAVAWTLVVLVGVALLPLSSSTSTSSTSDGATATTTTESTLLESEGLVVLGVLLVPTAVAFIGLVGAAFRMRAASIAAAVIALGFCVLGILSVGLFYLPAAVLLMVAAGRSTAPAREVAARSDRL